LDRDDLKGTMKILMRRVRVVWDHVKRQKYGEEPLVLGYTQWATERLPQLESFWQ